VPAWPKLKARFHHEACMNLTLFHAPDSRSGATRILLEELGAGYELRVLNLKQNQQRDAGYLAVNPMGKVPAILHGDALVTEQPAIFIYLADLYPQAGLAPALNDPLRGPYLRWMAFYGSSFEPAIIDVAMKRAPAPPSLCPYGDYDTMLATFTAQLRAGPYLLGERFSAADVLWGSALGWMTAFKLVPALPEIMAYVERVSARPAARKAAADDAELAAAQG
jgi:glutathione S-transferase